MRFRGAPDARDDHGLEEDEPGALDEVELPSALADVWSCRAPIPREDDIAPCGVHGIGGEDRPLHVGHAEVDPHRVSVLRTEGHVLEAVVLMISRLLCRYVAV